MRHALKLLGAGAISVLVLALMFHLLGGSETLSRDRLLEMARRVAVGGLLAGVLLTLVQTAVRALRYGVLLQAGGVVEPPPFRHLLLVTMTRNMLVDLLPARLGELSYVALLNRGFRLPVEPCLSSLSLSVLFDFAALLVLVLGLGLVHVLGGRAAGWMVGVALVLVLVLAGGLFALFRGPALAVSLLRRLPAWSWLAALCRWLERLQAAFELTRRSGVFGRTLGLSVLVRVAKYGGFFALFQAVVLHNFPAFASAGPPQVIGALLSAEAAAGVPVPTFMSFGAYEAGGVAAWTALGFPAAEAAVCMLVIHVVSQLVDYSLGGLGMLLLLARGGAGRSGAGRGWMAAVLSGAVLTAAGGVAVWNWRAQQKQGAREAPPPGQEVAAPAAGASIHLPRGFVVWTSNRSGNHDIWRMELPERRVSQVTTHPHAEYRPRISPDGRRLVFARALRPWVSQRNEMDWEVVLRSLADGHEEVLVREATAPDWSGPDSVTYQAQVGRVVEMDLTTRQTRVLCAAGQGDLPAGVQLQTPSFHSAASAVAVTLRGGRRGTVLVGLDGRVRAAGGGCQLGWTPDGVALLVTDDGGRMKNAFYRVDPASLERTLLFDAAEPWSHEYFPRLSPDGGWLAYGACAKGHEHDTADYEIFVWRVGDAVDQAARLTWHTGNDGWPDLWLEPAGPR